MSRPQASSSPDKQQTCRAKTKVVHKEEALRQAEASWNKQAREVQGLNILDRCKKFNEFLSKGLLREIELDEEILASSNLPAKQAAGAPRHDTIRPAAQHSTTSARQNSNHGTATVTARPRADSSAVTPRQPLKSRITAKESAALLDLLDETPAEECTTNKSPTTVHKDGNPPAEANLEAAGPVSPPTCSSASVMQQQFEATPQPPAAVDQHPPVSEAATEDDFELIFLLNSQGSSSLASVQSAAPGGSSGNNNSKHGVAAPVDLRQTLKQQRAAVTTQLYVCGVLVRRLAIPRLKQQLAIQHPLQEVAATCIQRAFRCRQARKMLGSFRRQWQQEEQQQLQQQLLQQRQALSIADKRESINAAWRGYYLTHGQSAACVIQRHWKAYQTKRQYQQQQAAAVGLQAVCRGWLVRRHTAAVLQMRMQERQRNLLQSASLQQQRLHRKEAALVLQSCSRGWLARKLLQQLLQQQQQAALAAAEANTAAAAACQGMQPAAECSLSGCLELCMQPVHTDKIYSKPDTVVSGTGSSSNNNSCGDDHSISTPRQISSRGSRSNRSNICSAVYQDSRLNRTSTSGIQQLQQSECKSTENDAWGPSRSSSSGKLAAKDSGAGDATPAEVNALTGRHLVIRSAADMRTATQHGDGSSYVGVGCTEQLAREMVWRAGELQVEEEQQQADLAVRATMAGSSFRKLHEAMVAVKARRDTS